MGCSACKASVADKPIEVIHLRSLKGEKLTIPCGPFDLVSDIQQKVSEAIKVPFQKIQIIKGGTILQPDQALKNSSIMKNDTLQYIITDGHSLAQGEVGPALIYIKDATSLRKIEIACEPQETVLSLKMKLEGEFSAKANEMTLMFSGQQLEDEKHLKDYKLQNCVTLNIVCNSKKGNPTIYVLTKAKIKREFAFNNEDSVYVLKSKISRELNLDTTTEVGLKHKGTVLKNEKCLKDYGIKAGDLIEMA